MKTFLSTTNRTDNTNIHALLRSRVPSGGTYKRSDVWLIREIREIRGQKLPSGRPIVK